MKIAIFGATGRTGRPLVDEALARGHEVRVLVRDSSRLSIVNPKLTIVQGDVMNPASVEETIQGQEAVISVLGHVKGSPADIQTVATRNIINAMHKHGLKRLVSLTGASVGDPHDQPKLADRVVWLVMNMPFGGFKETLVDARNHLALLQASDLEWVVVRGPRLTEGPRRGQYKVGFISRESGMELSRADLPDFLLKELTDNTYLGQLPLISY